MWTVGRKTVLLLVLVLVAGCKATLPLPPPDSTPQTRTQRPPVTSEPPAAEQAPAKPDARALASLELTAHGRRLIEEGQPDQAIAVLERAVNLHAGNGQNYYYLAQAWLMKENKAQARAFNRLAAMYLKDDGKWSRRVQLQTVHIDRLKP